MKKHKHFCSKKINFFFCSKIACVRPPEIKRDYDDDLGACTIAAEKGIVFLAINKHALKKGGGHGMNSVLIITASTRGLIFSIF